MYQHILITSDGSEISLTGVNHGLSLALAVSAKVTFITVTPSFPMMSGMLGDASYMPMETLNAYDQAQADSAKRLLDRLAAKAAQMGVQATTLHVPNSQASDAIVRSAKQLGCDLICMASHGRTGVKRLFLGSQTTEVLAHSHVPMLIVR